VSEEEIIAVDSYMMAVLEEEDPWQFYLKK